GSWSSRDLLALGQRCGMERGKAEPTRVRGRAGRERLDGKGEEMSTSSWLEDASSRPTLVTKDRRRHHLFENARRPMSSVGRWFESSRWRGYRPMILGRGSGRGPR